MRIITDREARAFTLRRLGWFVALWGAGVLAVGIVAAVLRWVMHAL